MRPQAQQTEKMLFKTDAPGSGSGNEAIPPISFEEFVCEPEPEDLYSSAWEQLSTMLHKARSGPDHVHTEAPCELLFDIVDQTCLHGFSARLYTDLAAEIDEYTCGIGSRLNAVDLSDPASLEVVAGEWAQFSANAAAIRDIFGALDTISPDMSVWTLCVLRLKANAIPSLTFDRLLHNILTTHDTARTDPDTARLELLRTLFSMAATLDYLTPEVETAMTARAAQHYMARQITLLEDTPVPEYFPAVAAILDQETSIADTVLGSPGLTADLRRTALDALITSHSTTLLEHANFITLLRDAFTGDATALSHLKAAADLLFHQRDALFQTIHTFIRSSTADSISTISDSTLLMRALVGLQHGAGRVATFCVPDSSAALVTRATAAFGDGVRQHQTAVSEALDVHLDGLLTAHTPAPFVALGLTVHEHISFLVDVFRRLDDKTLFEGLYTASVMRRLLHRQTADMALEEEVLATIRVQCGESFTAKLDGMMSDVREAEELWREFIEGHPAMGEAARVTVLNRTHWGLDTETRATLPKDLTDVQEAFRTFYLGPTKFPANRAMEFSTTHSTTHLEVIGAEGRSYKVVCPLPAGLVLLQLAEGPVALPRLVEVTGMPEAVVIAAIEALGGAGLTTRRGINVIYNTNFTSPSFIVTLGDGRASRPAPVASRRAELDLFRDTRIDSAIVRTMKRERRLAMGVLIDEIRRLIEERMQFGPVDVEVVKKRIEHLIENEYIKRNPVDKSELVYVAE